MYRELKRVAERLPSGDPWRPLLRAAQASLLTAAAGLANGLDLLEKALEWGERARLWAWDLLQSKALNDPWLRKRLGRHLYQVGRWVLAAAFADCSAYYNLGQPEIAWRFLEKRAKDLRLEDLEATAPWGLTFQAGILIGRLAYRAAAEGLSFREVQALYREGERFLETSLDDFHFHFHVGLVRYAAWALLRRETFPRHRRWIRQQLDPVIDGLPRLHPLEQVLVLRAWAELRWHEGEWEEAQSEIHKACHIAQEAYLPEA